MRIAIFVNESTTLLFTPPSAPKLSLVRMGGDEETLIAKMPVKPGIYKIESGTRVTPAPDPRIQVIVDADVMSAVGDPKDPFPPDGLLKTVHLATAATIQGFFANSFGK